MAAVDALLPSGSTPSQAGAGARAYQGIREAILDGELPPGTPLGEVELAARFGVSRTPVRQALRRLLDEGLAEQGRRRQIVVRAIPAERYDEILRLRRRSSGSRSRRLRGPDHGRRRRARLLVIRQRRAANEGRSRDFLRLDQEFHLGIARRANLPLVAKFLAELRAFELLLGLDSAAVPGNTDLALEAHDAILDAFERRDRQAAVATLAKHIRRFELVLLKRRQDELDA